MGKFRKISCCCQLDEKEISHFLLCKREEEEEGKKKAHHLRLRLNHLPAFMSLKLIIYGDIFEHGELHQGELFSVNSKKKEKNEGNFLLVFNT